MHLEDRFYNGVVAPAMKPQPLRIACPQKAAQVFSHLHEYFHYIAHFPTLHFANEIERPPDPAPHWHR